MEPVFEALGAWWWVAPAVISAGAVGYGILTANRRRARRLEVDAARQEVATAQAAIVAARADVRQAQAQLLAEQADRGTWVPAFLSAPDAHRDLQNAKRAHRSALLTLRARRIAVTAARARMHATAGEPAGTPLSQAMARHDAITARWLDYETDVAKLIAYPKMTDARHPATGAFLIAQREATRLRPASPVARVTLAEYLSYRDAVQSLETAFTSAEREARRTASR